MGCSNAASMIELVFDSQILLHLQVLRLRARTAHW